MPVFFETAIWPSLPNTGHSDGTQQLILFPKNSLKPGIGLFSNGNQSGLEFKGQELTETLSGRTGCLEGNPHDKTHCKLMREHSNYHHESCGARRSHCRFENHCTTPTCCHSYRIVQGRLSKIMLVCEFRH